MNRARYLRIASLIFATVAAAAAGQVSQGPSTYIYDLSLPTFDANDNPNGTFDFQFSWLGPLQYNAPDGSLCPNGCPVTGTTPGSPEPFFFYNPSLSDFTATTTPAACSSSPSGGCSQVDLAFTEEETTDLPGGNSFLPPTITFTLVEPDSFWATLGFQTFPANLDGANGIGASYVFSGGAPADLGSIACENCSVDTSTTPEPATSILILGGLAGFILTMRRFSSRT